MRALYWRRRSAKRRKNKIHCCKICRKLSKQCSQSWLWKSEKLMPWGSDKRSLSRSLRLSFKVKVSLLSLELLRWLSTNRRELHTFKSYRSCAKKLKINKRCKRNLGWKTTRSGRWKSTKRAKSKKTTTCDCRAGTSWPACRSSDRLSRPLKTHPIWMLLPPAAQKSILWAVSAMTWVLMPKRLPTAHPLSRMKSSTSSKSRTCFWKNDSLRRNQQDMPSSRTLNARESAL